LPGVDEVVRQEPPLDGEEMHALGTRVLDELIPEVSQHIRGVNEKLRQIRRRSTTRFAPIGAAANGCEGLSAS
jgi:hypothetical protein